MAERTPVVKKYRDALENVIGATMEFLAQSPPSKASTNTTETQDPAPPTETPTPSIHDLPNSLTSFSPGFAGNAPESFVRSAPKNPDTKAKVAASTEPGLGVCELYDPIGRSPDPDAFGYIPETHKSPGSTGRWEGRHGELGQMDAEWLLSLCEGDGFNLQMLNEMMRFEPSLGA
jgi:hypothetical protein